MFRPTSGPEATTLSIPGTAETSKDSPIIRFSGSGFPNSVDNRIPPHTTGRKYGFILRMEGSELTDFLRMIGDFGLRWKVSIRRIRVNPAGPFMSLLCLPDAFRLGFVVKRSDELVPVETCVCQPS
jgi:hypothetical protein